MSREMRIGSSSFGRTEGTKLQEAAQQFLQKTGAEPEKAAAAMLEARKQVGAVQGLGTQGCDCQG